MSTEARFISLQGSRDPGRRGVYVEPTASSAFTSSKALASTQTGNVALSFSKEKLDVRVYGEAEIQSFMVVKSRPIARPWALLVRAVTRATPTSSSPWLYLHRRLLTYNYHHDASTCQRLQRHDIEEISHPASNLSFERKRGR